MDCVTGGDPFTMKNFNQSLIVWEKGGRGRHARDVFEQNSTRGMGIGGSWME